MDATVKPGIENTTEPGSDRSLQEKGNNRYYFEHDPWVGELVQHVENLLRETARSDNSLMESIGRHMLFGYAKRLRPIFVLLSQKLFLDDLLPGTVECAAAAELIHSASLFHDDVIDGSSRRKGRESANSRWGNKSAVIMGDHFFVLAYNLISRQKDLRVIDFFVDLCRSLSEGIMMEIKYTGDLGITEERHIDVSRLKTASFFESAMIIGGYLAGVSESDIENIEGFGLNFGLAFQLSDDLLDLFADPEATGKPRGSDIRGGIYTVPVINALATDDDFSGKFRTIIERGKITPDEIDEISGSLVSNGSLEYSQAMVKEYAELAYDYLEKLPTGRAASSFRGMLDNIVAREF